MNTFLDVEITKHTDKSISFVMDMLKGFADELDSMLEAGRFNEPDGDQLANVEDICHHNGEDVIALIDPDLPYNGYWRFRNSAREGIERFVQALRHITDDPAIPHKLHELFDAEGDYGALTEVIEFACFMDMILDRRPISPKAVVLNEKE